MTVSLLGVPSFGANCYFIHSGSNALVVDPSHSADAILAEAERLGVTVTGILLTHGHFDHTSAVDTLRDRLNVPLMIHREDAVMLTDGKRDAFYDLFGRENRHRPAELLLEDGQHIPLGGESVCVLHTPGHTRGSVCFLCGEFLITGDTLFADNVGRCDLWGGSYATIRQSLKHLRDYDGTLTILPGHGDSNTLSKALDNTMYI
jgi:glyoxylase-like metal-dependent hydrolase (beta-lactamase superfamily II)